MHVRYKDALVNYHRRFIEEFLPQFRRLGKLDHESTARLVRNWMLETDNLLQYNPIFEETPNTIDNPEENRVFENFISDVNQSIEIWEETKSNYTGGMSRKLRESFSTTELPNLTKTYGRE